MMCSNDYLGFANHPAVVEALAEGARRYGAGSGASHLVSGHSRVHAELEELLASRLASCIPQARALFFCSGYMANLGVLTALGDADATILADKLNHASLLDGAMLSRAVLRRFPRGRYDLLQRQLSACTTPLKIIVTDAVFSMDGDVSDLPALLELAERFDAWIVVDDAHGFGVLGEKGRGTLAHFNLCSERFVYIGTLGKAAGVSGGFVAAHRTIVDWLINQARTYIYTTAAPPAVAHALLTSLELLAGVQGNRRREQLTARIEQLRNGVAELLSTNPSLAWRFPLSSTAIQPLILGSNETALALSAALSQRGVWVPAIRPPTVPAGTARLRVALSSAHEMDDVKLLLAALAATAS